VHINLGIQLRFTKQLKVLDFLTVLYGGDTMKQKVTNQTRRKILIGGATAASTPLWM